MVFPRRASNPGRQLALVAARLFRGPARLSWLELVSRTQEMGGVRRNADGGQRWVDANRGIPPGTEVLARALAPLGFAGEEPALLAGTRGGGLFTSADGASSWRQLGTADGGPDWGRITIQTVIGLPGTVPAVAIGTKGHGVLIREARTCASLYHPNIIVIYDIDIDQGLLVEEFLPGGSLRDLLEAAPVLAFNDVLSLGEQMADGLAAAHGAGVIHRDLKPENILLTGRARRPGAENGGALPPVKLAVFGTALRRVERSGVPR